MSESDPDQRDARGPVHDLLRLQTDFQQRLASETLRYLRQLQGLVGPTVPGTMVLPDPGFELAGDARPGASLTLSASLENRQRVHGLVSPSLSPLVSDAGVTWFPDATIEPASMLLASGETGIVSIDMAIPKDLPGGIYRGALLLHGFERGALPVRVGIALADIDAKPPRTAATPRKPAAKPALKPGSNGGQKMSGQASPKRKARA